MCMENKEIAAVSQTVAISLHIRCSIHPAIG